MINKFNEWRKVALERKNVSSNSVQNHKFGWTLKSAWEDIKFTGKVIDKLQQNFRKKLFTKLVADSVHSN